MKDEILGELKKVGRVAIYVLWLIVIIGGFGLSYLGLKAGSASFSLPTTEERFSGLGLGIAIVAAGLALVGVGTSEFFGTRRFEIIEGKLDELLRVSKSEAKKVSVPPKVTDAKKGGGRHSEPELRLWLLIGVVIVVGVLLAFLAGLSNFAPTILTPILQGSVLAAIVGGIFKTVSDAVTARSKIEQFRFEKIYPKQVEVIEKLQSKTVELEGNIQSLVNPLQMKGREGQKEMIPKINETGRELQKHLLENRIYLRPALCDSLEKMTEQYFKIWWKWNVDLNSGPEPILPPADEWNAEWERVTKELPNIRKRLEDEYREIFGIR